MITTLETKSSHLFLLPAAAFLLCTFFPFTSSAQTRTSAYDGAGKYTGPGSCASTSCHGSVTPRTENNVLQNEYSTWIVKDKHAQSYKALTGNVGERMAGILGLGKAETAPRCLACHALNPPAEERSRTFDVSEGVSCESCHGPASGWLGPHTERDWTHQKSVALGMVDTRDLVKRTEKCLSCHLGSEQKFVDHEMIAGGHPDLFFELDSFSAVMPRHWKEPGEPGATGQSDPWYDVREMTTGQAVQLRESMLRLASRSRGKIWPEYSEMQCYACHHSLTPPEQSWRQARGYEGRRPGDPPWNASRYAVFRDVVHQLDGQDAGQLDDQISQLTKLMSQLNPDRDAVASAATNSAHLADALVAKIQCGGLRSGVHAAAAAENFQRRGRHFGPGRTVRRAGSHGDSVPIRRLQPGRETAKRRGTARRDHGPVSAARDSIGLRSDAIRASDAASECPPEVNRAGI